jgi:hypothetical protein
MGLSIARQTQTPSSKLHPIQEEDAPGETRANIFEDPEARAVLKSVLEKTLVANKDTQGKLPVANLSSRLGYTLSPEMAAATNI